MIRSLIIPYDIGAYSFRSHVCRGLGILYSQMESLHLGQHYEKFSRGRDQNTLWHEIFYDAVVNDAQWKWSYGRFITQLTAMVGEPIVYQRIPTFRVHLPGNIAVAEPHRDRDYNHSPNEINVWVPLTDAMDTSAVWLETRENSYDYLPMELGYGHMAIFDGANLRHFNKSNTEGYTRVSFDLRYIPESLYVPNPKSTLNTNLPFRLPESDGELTYWAKSW